MIIKKFPTAFCRLALLALAVASLQALSASAQQTQPKPSVTFPATDALKRLHPEKNGGASSPASVNIPKIVNGKPADKGQFLWQAALIFADAPDTNIYGGFFCGGTLIAPDVVLTAAHCTYTDNPDDKKSPIALEPGEVDVYLGAIVFQGGARLHVTGIERHEGYDTKTHDNDIALLKIEKGRTAKLKLAPVSIAPGEVSEREIVTAVGWGSTAAGIVDPKERVASVHLQYADKMEIRQSASCNRTHLALFRENYTKQLNEQGYGEATIAEAVNREYPLTSNLITPNMFCAGADDSSQDTCFGDSGGPLLINRSGLKQAGIVSWGPSKGCALGTAYGVYVRLSRYLGWIKEHGGL